MQRVLQMFYLTSSFIQVPCPMVGERGVECVSQMKVCLWSDPVQIQVQNSMQNNGDRADNLALRLDPGASVLAWFQNMCLCFQSSSQPGA